MSSTNLTDKKSKVCFSIINCQRNRLRPDEEYGDATKTSDPYQSTVALGISDMQLKNTTIIINSKGHRGNNTQRKDMKKMDYKRKRMEKINEETIKEQEQAKKAEKSKNPEAANEQEI